MNNRILTKDDLRRYAPATFAEVPSTTVSDRYSMIPTERIVDVLESKGFFPTQVQEQRVRNQERQGFQKHLLRFRQAEQMLRVGDSLPEIVLTNAHDGTSAFVFHAGIFRLVCSNGLVIAESTFAAFRVRHSGDVSQVLPGVERYIETLPLIFNKVESWMKKPMSPDEQAAFALRALKLRWEDSDKAPISSKKLLTPRRREDTGGDLWSTFNRVQENLMKGGQVDSAKYGWHETENGMQYVPVKRTRMISSIDENVRINKALWETADEFATV